MLRFSSRLLVSSGRRQFLREEKLTKDTMAHLTGVPKKNLQQPVLIYNYAPATTQNESNDKRSNYWVVRFSEQERWGHNLMGWTSTRDPNHGLRLEFPTKDAAIQFAEAEGYSYTIEDVAHRRSKIPVKEYSDNFVYSPPKDETENLY